VLLIQFLAVFIFSTGTVHSWSTPVDSVGVRKIGKENYIIHKVDQGETLYALSRRYHVTLDEIRKANPEIDQNLDIGQEIKIPIQGIAISSPVKQGRIEHRVRSGETLYSISQKYDVSIADIKKWNNRNSNTLSIGEILLIFKNPAAADKYNQMQKKKDTNGKIIHIVNDGETLFSISEKYNVSPIDLKDWNRMDNNMVYIGQELIIGYTDDPAKKVQFTNRLEVKEEKKGEVNVKRKETENPPMVKKTDEGDYKKVTEVGIARIIEGSDQTKKYLAMHRTAPIGTIMKVRNEMNDLTVFVRVIGKLPETDANRNVLLKISKTAYDRLGAFEDQFPVEITYHP
jgi:LysM repeat protein